MLLIFQQAASSAATVSKTPLPLWVSDLAIPTAQSSRLAQVKDGTYYLLASRQLRMQDGVRTRYRRYAIKITSRQGLENASKIQIGFRPDVDELFIHRIIVHGRDGSRDLTDRIRFEVFQQEDQLEKGILSGNKTAFANLPRVKVGDTVEYAFSLRYKTILMSDDIFTIFKNSYNVPTGLIESRVVLPKEMAPKFNYLGKKYEPKIQSVAGENIYTWITSDPEPVSTEDEVPEWYDVHDFIDISTVSSWADVAKNSISHYEDRESLPDYFLSDLDKISANSKSKKEIVSKVLSLVQTDIRYVGIEIGKGAFIPRPPKLVLERGYGDCKDKAYLMVSALKKLGIEASPVLAHLRFGNSINKQLPTPYAFNHVIVKAKADGETYWLDPTRTYQESPDPKMSQANYGYVLTIDNATTDLEYIEPVVPAEPLTAVDEEIHINYDTFANPITLRVTSVYRGGDADRIRINYASNSVATYEKGYLEYYQKYYTGIVSVKPMVIEDDQIGNVLKTIEVYTVPASVGNRAELFKDLYIRGDAVRSKLTEIDSDARKFPVQLDYPFYYQHRTIFKNLKTKLEPLDKFEISNPYLDFSLLSKVEGDSLEALWTIRSKRNHVKPSEVKRYREIFDDVATQTSWVYDVTQ